MAEVVGSAVSQTYMAQMVARSDMPKAVFPYVEAAKAYLRYQSKDYAGSLRLAQRALKGLATDEFLLRMRLTAIAADAAAHLGKRDVAQRHFDTVMHKWPTALRVLGIRLPAKVEGGRDSVAQKAAALLVDSRRLDTRRTGYAFVVRVRRANQALTFCLNGPGGRRYVCINAKLDTKLPVKEQVERALDEFHGAAFAPLVDLTQQDINSLDGRAVRGRADEVLKEALGR